MFLTGKYLCTGSIAAVVSEKFPSLGGVAFGDFPNDGVVTFFICRGEHYSHVVKCIIISRRAEVVTPYECGADLWCLGRDGNLPSVMCDMIPSLRTVEGDCPYGVCADFAARVRYFDYFTDIIFPNCDI